MLLDEPGVGLISEEDVGAHIAPTNVVEGYPFWSPCYYIPITIISTQQSSLAHVLPGKGILDLLEIRRFWEWWRISWTYFHLVLAGGGLFVSFRLYIYTVEYLITENSFISVTKGYLRFKLFGHYKIFILPTYSSC